MSQSDESTRSTTPPRGTDPMRSFRGVMAGTLVIEVIVAGLALLAGAKLGDGFGGVDGWASAVVIVALLLCCGLLRYRWAPWAIMVVQLVMIGCVVVSVPLAIVGVIFGLVWGGLLWMRHDVARRMARGTLSWQQPGASPVEDAPGPGTPGRE